MFLSRPIRKRSSREQLQIEAIENDLLVLPGGQYRLILEASSVNFELMSEAEQDALIEGYEGFLNSLPFPLQLRVRTREMDIQKYLEEFTARFSSSPETEAYTEFVRSLISKNRILSRRFYIVLPYSQAEPGENFPLERLLISSDIVSKGLLSLGIKTRRLSSLEIVDLFYEYYSSERARLQPLSARLFISAKTEAL